MPSQHQLQMALKEVADLKRELESLNNAQDANEAAKRIRQYIANTQEGLVDEENDTAKDDPCCCGCQIL